MDHDMDEVFARATGPRMELGSENFDCPWCGADCIEVFDDDPVTTCPACGKEFVCPDERGQLVCVGLIQSADIRYIKLFGDRYALPNIALSVRQPWAWAIVAGLKDVENRTSAAVTKGGFTPRDVAIHAAKGMTRDEYEEASEFMGGLGITCPRPDALVRGAIIGGAAVTAVVKHHESKWFFGPRGLVLRGAAEVDPIPAVGALGYFRWKPTPGGEVAAPLPWMRAWPFRARCAPTAAPLPLLDGRLG